MPDWRHIRHGRTIPTQSYCDQPYLLRTDDGAWLCCVTTGPGGEGAEGQHVATLRSTDQGRTWSQPVPVEPGDRRENSYAVMLKAPSGRIFIFYNHNTDRIRRVLSHDRQQTFSRVDSLGHFVFKYSDDHGRSWSARRHPIPVRRFPCDRRNVYGGRLCFFWNVGRPWTFEGTAYVPLVKIGRLGPGFIAQSEGVLLASPDLLTTPLPGRARWETLPEGEIGLRTPPGGGPIAEEQSYCVLSDGTFSCVYRSLDGYPVETLSRDKGRTWSQPRYRCFANGRRMKHPRAANFTWRCANGKFLYWFHNHGGARLRERPDLAAGGAYEDRNPVWLCAGLEVETPTGRDIAWSEPEILFYDHDPYIRISYPDLLEENGRYFLTETQKNIARIHEIPARLLDAMWDAVAETLGQAPATTTFSREGLLVGEPRSHRRAMPTGVPLPTLPWFRVRDDHAPDYRGKDTGHGLALDLWMTLPDLAPGRILLDNRDAGGCGFYLSTAPNGALTLSMNDGQTENHASSDPVCQAGRLHHAVINVDGGPRIVSFIVDGQFHDGGDARQFGWTRFSPYLRHVNGAPVLRVDRSIKVLRIYGRILLTAEAVRHHRLGPMPCRTPAAARPC